MKKLMMVMIVLVVGVTTFVFAQAPAVKVPTAEEIKEALKKDAQDVKKDAIKMKEAVEQDIKEGVIETKASVKEVEKAVEDEVGKAKLHVYQLKK